MPQERLADPWVARATAYLCKLFRQTQDIALECGALYHAAHGLVLYRERVYGPRTYAPSASINAALRPSAALRPLRLEERTTALIETQSPQRRSAAVGRSQSRSGSA